jgi:hypothetical protein
MRIKPGAVSQFRSLPSPHLASEQWADQVSGISMRAAARRAPTGDQQAERMRTRVRILVQLTTVGRCFS